MGHPANWKWLFLASLLLAGIAADGPPVAGLAAGLAAVGFAAASVLQPKAPPPAPSSQTAS